MLNIVCWIPTDFGFAWLSCTIPRMNSILDIKAEMVGKDLKERVEVRKFLRISSIEENEKKRT